LQIFYNVNDPSQKEALLNLRVKNIDITRDKGKTLKEVIQFAEQEQLHKQYFPPYKGGTRKVNGFVVCHFGIPIVVGSEQIPRWSVP